MTGSDSDIGTSAQYRTVIDVLKNTAKVYRGMEKECNSSGVDIPRVGLVKEFWNQSESCRIYARAVAETLEFLVAELVARQSYESMPIESMIQYIFEPKVLSKMNPPVSINPDEPSPHRDALGIAREILVASKIPRSR